MPERDLRHYFFLAFFILLIIVRVADVNLGELDVGAVALAAGQIVLKAEEQIVAREGDGADQTAKGAMLILVGAGLLPIAVIVADAGVLVLPVAKNFALMVFDKGLHIVFGGHISPPNLSDC